MYVQMLNLHMYLTYRINTDYYDFRNERNLSKNSPLQNKPGNNQNFNYYTESTEFADKDVLLQEPV